MSRVIAQRLAFLCSALAFLVLCPLLVFGSQEGPIEVYQPILGHDAGITISRVTYLVFSGGALRRTCAEVLCPTSHGYENRNMANLVGIKLSVAYNTEEQREFFGDTVKVTLDLSNAEPKVWGYPLEDIVPPTFQCMLLNAAKRARFMEVHVEGPDMYLALEGVYALDPFRDPGQVKTTVRWKKREKTLSVLLWARECEDGRAYIQIDDGFGERIYASEVELDDCRVWFAADEQVNEKIAPGVYYVRCRIGNEEDVTPLVVLP